MNKQDALARLDAIEKEQAELRRIIEAPEVVGLWKPDPGGQRFALLHDDGHVADTYYHDSPMDNDRIAFGNCFQTQDAAEKAAPLMARANKIIAAALQADPDAGVWAKNVRCFTATISTRKIGWGVDSYSGDTSSQSGMAAFVHTSEQAEHMAAILNAEQVK